LVEVADKSHQLKEINEQVAKSSQDFGDRLSNVNGVVAGMSGAIQTALGTLSLFGVEVGDDVKMLKLLQSAMAITQGVAAIDAGVKSFKALSVSIRAATTAANGLKSALIKTGIGALVVVLGVLVAKIVEMAEATTMQRGRTTALPRLSSDSMPQAMQGWRLRNPRRSSWRPKGKRPARSTSSGAML
jgi:hypothetical protein